MLSVPPLLRITEHSRLLAGHFLWETCVQLGLAMSEASKLFDQSGGAASGGKQDAINSAGATIMKFMLKSQMSGMMGTGGGAAGGGGLGNLVSMASK